MVDKRPDVVWAGDRGAWSVSAAQNANTVAR